MEIHVGNLAYAMTDEGLKAAVAAASAVIAVPVARPAGNRLIANRINRHGRIRPCFFPD